MMLLRRQLKGCYAISEQRAERDFSHRVLAIVRNPVIYERALSKIVFRVVVSRCADGVGTYALLWFHCLNRSLETCSELPETSTSL